jgi:hypothetical protein
MTLLQARMGIEPLRQRLIDRFFELGRAGALRARTHYAAQGLDVGRRGPLGLALQRLLEAADSWVRARGLETAEGAAWITSRRCGFEIRAPRRWSRESAY